MTTVTWDWAAATPGRTSKQTRMLRNIGDLNAPCIAQAFQPVGRNSEAYSAILWHDIGAIRYCAYELTWSADHAPGAPYHRDFMLDAS